MWALHTYPEMRNETLCLFPPLMCAVLFLDCALWVLAKFVQTLRCFALSAPLNSFVLLPRLRALRALATVCELDQKISQQDPNAG
jgi:type III secretory pathway component EscT